MGRIVKQVSAHSTRYYWYPGELKEWLRGALSIVAGMVVYAALHQLTRRTLLAAVVGTSVSAAIAGVNFGRRDSRELVRFGEIARKAARRQAVGHTGRAVWRGIAEGTGGAAAAIIVVNLAEGGILANWILPLVPAAVGALGHQIGMMYERLGVTKSIVGPANPVRLAATPPTPPAGIAASSRDPAPVPATGMPMPGAVAAVPAVGSLDAPVPVPVAFLTPVKSVRPPMPLSVALVELAEAHRAERAQAGRDTARAGRDAARAGRATKTGRHVGRATVAS